jgi:hypothetical protein
MSLVLFVVHLALPFSPHVLEVIRELTRLVFGFCLCDLILAVLVCYSHCSTDYIAVYQGSTPSSHLLTTVCGNRKTQLQYSGPNLLLEFR